MSDKLVYSTAPNKDSKPRKGKISSSGKGPIKMRLEKKGRGGKQVTILFNLPYSDEEGKAFMKELQEKLACGATYKKGEIQFRGDNRDAIGSLLATRGIKFKRAGG